MKQNDWNNVVKRYIPSIVKKLFTDITLFKKQSDDIFNIIYRCIEDVNDRKSWCEKNILDMLLLHVNKPNPLVKKIITNLFCFQGKTFKCSLCLGRSTSPRRWPISFISSFTPISQKMLRRTYKENSGMERRLSTKLGSVSHFTVPIV